MRTLIRPAVAAATTALVAATTAVTTPHAHAATGVQVYEGVGWKIATFNGVRYLGSGSWRIVFHDTNSRTQLTPYAKATAGQLNKWTGVPFYVTSTISTGGTAKCPTGRVIIMRLTSTVTRSTASQCHTASGAADGSRATFALSNWTNTKVYNSNEIYRRKVISHELGHSVGLAHPTVYTTNPSPLMRGDVWGGYGSLTYAGWYTGQDVEGLRNLRANASKTPPPVTTTVAVNGAQALEDHH